MHPYLRYAHEKQAEIIDFLKEMVECESPTDSPADVNRFVDLIVEQTKDIAVAKILEADGYGRHLLLEFKLPGDKKEGQILALGHSDTVWPLGTLQAMPFRQADGRLWGPGVLDVKSGLAFFVYAVRALRDLDIPVNRKVVLLIVSDEETGSHSSRALTEAQALCSDYVLVLEPGTGLSGKLKTARKGIAAYTIWVTGKPAHAGVDFSCGASAVLEAARQVEKVARWTEIKRGITVNPGVISGGTRRNVIAAEARIEVDARAERMEDAETTDQRFRSLRPVDERCTLRIEGGLIRPPMQRVEAIAKLFAKAQGIGAELGLNLEESSSGGGSDGNFTAALGVPTLDGLGGVGEGAHAMNESILVDRIADRTALLAGLLGAL
jgi:glutamate carboxypeptidase